MLSISNSIPQVKGYLSPARHTDYNTGLMPASTSFDIAVIGGGAAGFFAALTAAELAPGAHLVILERAPRPLAKVRISGGGRCNVTHACFDPAVLVNYYPRGSRELRGPFTRFNSRHTIDWFEQRGVRLKTEADGRVFPTSDDSQTIIDCLLAAARRLEIQVWTRCTVQSLKPTGAGFLLNGEHFEPLQANKVLLAAGGASKSAYALAAGLGHTIIPPVPSLFSFELRPHPFKDLAGVSVTDCQARLQVAPAANRPKPLEFTARGPLLVTHWGFSGPAILRLSAWGARALAESAYRAQLRLNWLPDSTVEQVFDALVAYQAARPRQAVASHTPFSQLPIRLWAALVDSAGIPAAQTWGSAAHAVLRLLAAQLTDAPFTVSGKGAFKDEFVTAGGITLSEVNFKTMESRLQPGFFLAGEVLDIDGLTGGFNFQSAWTTGWLAGHGLAGCPPP